MGVVRQRLARDETAASVRTKETEGPESEWALSSTPAENEDEALRAL
jgi:hypothetical protein